MKEERRRDDPRIAQLLADMTSVQLCLAKNTEITSQVRDILTSFRMIALLAKWIAAVGAAVAAVIAAWHSFKA